MHTISRKAFISTHSFGKALCYIKYALVDRRDLDKKNSCTCKALPIESMKASDVICCILDNESCAQEASRLRGFYDCDAMEVTIKRCNGVEVLTSLIS